jgi:hypothetical protein
VTKRFTFGTAPGSPAGASPAQWPSGSALRAVTCTVIPELSDPGGRHDQITVEWFGYAGNLTGPLSRSDPENSPSDSQNSSDLQNFSHSPQFATLGTSRNLENSSHSTNVSHWKDFSDSPQMGSQEPVLAIEHILRGHEWLARRWDDGGEKLKHMALATRAAGLTQAEFSQRWKSHAGNAGAAVIPREARGLAYVQNHPVPGDWPYDAVNEVYFDDVDGLRARVEWFRANVPNPADGVLFGRSWLIAVREVVVS